MTNLRAKTVIISNNMGFGMSLECLDMGFDIDSNGNEPLNQRISEHI